MPESAPKQLDLYVMAGLSKTDIRLTCLLADNSVWRFNEDGTMWEKISNGVPPGSTIKALKPFMSLHGKWDTRYAAQLSDNTIGCFTLADKWEPIPLKGLKEGADIRFLGGYGKMSQMGGGQDNYVALVDGKTMWSSKNGGKWEEVSTNGLPSGFSINRFDAILKLAMFSFSSNTPEPKLFVCLDDQTMWGYIPGNRSWYDIDNKGLPGTYKIKTFRVYQKFGNATVKIQILACMEDNTMWNYTDKEGWVQVSTTGLPLSK